MPLDGCDPCRVSAEGVAREGDAILATMPIVPYKDKAPQFGQSVFVDPMAVIIGDVVLGDNVNIWFGTVIRGDDNKIRIGARTSVQDNSVLHTTPQWPTFSSTSVPCGTGVSRSTCASGLPNSWSA